MGTATPAQGDIDPNWYNSAYLARVLNFSDAIKEQGLEKALESHVASMFQADAVNTIYKAGGIKDFLTNKAKPLVDTNGNTYAIEVDIDSKTKLYLNPSSDEVIGRDYGNITERGKFGIDKQTGKFGLTSGVVRQGFNGYFTETYIESGKIISFNVFGQQDNSLKLSLFNEETPDAGFEFNPDTLDVKDVTVYEAESGMVTTFKDDTITNTKQFKGDEKQTTTGEFNAGQFETMETLKLKLQEIFINDPNTHASLLANLDKFRRTRGFNSWGSITYNKTKIVVPGQDSSLTEEISLSQDFRPPDTIAFVGKDLGFADISGGVTIDTTGIVPIVNGSFEARFKKDIYIPGVASTSVGGMIGLEKDFATIAGTQSLTKNIIPSGKAGTYMSSDSPNAKYEYRTYVEKEIGVPKKLYYQFTTTGLTGQEIESKCTIDANGIRQKITERVPVTNNEKNALLLYEVTIGARTNLTAAEKEGITQFMYEKARSITFDNPNIDQAQLFTTTKAYVDNIVGLTNDLNAKMPKMITQANVNYNQLSTYNPARFTIEPSKWGYDFTKFMFKVQ